MSVDLEVVTVVGVVALALKSFIYDYLKEKAKNVATKEDIGEITRRVEDVRFQYTQKLEQIRSELQIISQHEAGLRGRGIEAWVGFFEKVLLLIVNKLEVHPPDVGYERGLSIHEYRRDLINLFVEINSSYFRLRGYTPSHHEALESAKSLLDEINRVRRQVLEELQSVSVKLDELFRSKPEEKLLESLVAVRELMKAVDAYNSRIRPEIESLRGEFERFTEAFGRYLEEMPANPRIKETTGAAI